MTQTPHASRAHERRACAWAAGVVLALGLGVPYGVERYARALGPLDLSRAQQGSVVALDREGLLLRAFTTGDDKWRLPVRHSDVDPGFLRMLIAFEDQRFFAHGGVDVRALGRAGAQLVASGRVVSGGSTLTMQAARLLEPREERTVSAKVRQMTRALQMERSLAKTDVLDVYLALAPYGGNLEGVRAASLAYFGKEPRRLTTAEQALLVALPQAPEARRPDRDSAAARAARDRVLDRAAARGVITHAEAAAAKREPVPQGRRRFPMHAAHAAQAHFAQAHLAQAHARANEGRRELRFTYERRLQASMETLAREAAERLGPKITSAILVIDNATGEVRARVGSADYFSSDRAGAVDMTQALRSPGSALKPFIYAMAFESGLAHPETIVEDRPVRYAAYAPENFDLQHQGQVSARTALQQSLNVPAVDLLAEVGPAQLLARLRNAGASVVVPGDQPPGLAIALGGVGITLHDLATAYASLARGGAPTRLVERRDGLVQAPERAGACDPLACWYVADILRGAPPPTHGLAGRIAFKTGTSYGYRDSFAVGFDARLTIAVWFGRADNGAVPGLVARQAAAPVLFEAFARAGARYEAPRRPMDALVATNAELPPALRRFGKAAVPAADAQTQRLRIAFPPEGARIDVRGAGMGVGELALKGQGGAPPYTWMVNGARIGDPSLRREAHWRPDGAGFARISVIDAAGATDTVLVRLE